MALSRSLPASFLKLPNCENFTSSFDRLRQKIGLKSVPHVQHDCLSSFNQSNHWFVALTLPSSFFKLPNRDLNKTSLKNKHLRIENYFAIIAFPRVQFCWKITLQAEWKEFVELNIENERFSVVCSRCIWKFLLVVWQTMCSTIIFPH